MITPETYGLTHAALLVNDIQRTLKFYTEVFGMVVMYHTEGFLQLTTPGCNDIVVFERTDKPIEGRNGITHLGFRLRDPQTIERVIERITNAGGRIKSHGEFVPGSPYVFFEDPDGYELEVWYELLPQS